MINKILVIVTLLIFVLIGYRLLQPKHTIKQPAPSAAANIVTQPALTATDIDDIPLTYVDADPTSESTMPPVLNTQPAASAFSCDGRQHCSQMTSCAEATYFINNCPSTKMDGNNDGIPCEQQWCHWYNPLKRQIRYYKSEPLLTLLLIHSRQHCPSSSCHSHKIYLQISKLP